MQAPLKAQMQCNSLSWQGLRLKLAQESVEVADSMRCVQACPSRACTTLSGRTRATWTGSACCCVRLLWSCTPRR